MPPKKAVRMLVLVMTLVVTSGILTAYFYYREMNRRVDPRIVPARQLYDQYNRLAPANDFPALLTLLDSIEGLYRSVPHYRESFETGVVANNRAAIYLTFFLHKDSLPGYYGALSALGKDSLLSLAKAATDSAISIYGRWSEMYTDHPAQAIESMIRPGFLKGLEDQEENHQEKYLEQRVREITLGLEELNRRLSVAYTNRGIIERHRQNYQGALENYRKALDLWPDNLSAENNINILLNRPLKKRNFLQKLFPKQK